QNRSVHTSGSRHREMALYSEAGVGSHQPLRNVRPPPKVFSRCPVLWRWGGQPCCEWRGHHPLLRLPPCPPIGHFVRLTRPVLHSNVARFCLATTIGLGMALSVGAQTTTDEQQQQQQPAQPKGKAKVEQSTGVQENASTGTVKEKGEVKAEASKQGGNVSQSTTVFRHGQQ